MSVSSGLTASWATTVPPELLDVLGEDIGKLLGVEAAVVDGRDLLESELVHDEFGSHPTLHLVVMRDAEIGVHVLGRIGEIGCGVGRRDHHQASLVDDRSAHACLGGAGRTDDRDDARVRGETSGGSLSALRIAAGILTHQLDLVAEELAAEVIDGDFDSSLGVLTELGRAARDGQHPSQDDWFTRLDLEDTDRIGSAWSPEQAGAAGSGSGSRCRLRLLAGSEDEHQ
jgi:phosphatidylserine/phosphatidylglycerophosphate/cardiolipin synthase-like enzyme